jgi:hypothetical protein
MDMNGIIFITSLCFTILVVFHIITEHIKDKRYHEHELREKRKRVRDALKRLDWKQKV